MNIIKKFIKSLFNSIYNFAKNVINFILKNIKKIIIIAAVIYANIWFVKSPFWKQFIELDIVKSNAVTFLIIISFFGFIAYKTKLLQKLQNGVDKIKESIDNSDAARENSAKELEETSKEVANVEGEIQEIIDNSENNTENQKQKIENETTQQIEYIKESTKKTISAKEREIISGLSKKTILASLELARRHVIKLLEQNPDYHQKFIQESIEELDRLK